MRNPWTTKNPAMSMWLSAANRVAGAARGQASAATRRNVATAQAEFTRQVLDFWSGKPVKTVKRKKARR
jgi:hypothetical protein